MSRLCNYILAGLLVSSASGAALADDAQEKNTPRRIAMALPKSPSTSALRAAVVPATAKTVTANSNSIGANTPNPADEFATRPHVSSQPSKAALPTNVREALVDGAAKVEQLSRSYNRRVADVIVWFIDSFNQPLAMTPSSGKVSSGAKSATIKPAPQTEKLFLQID